MGEGRGMNIFAYKCTKCGAVNYNNTTRRSSTRCPSCDTFSLKRSTKDDRRDDLPKTPACLDLCEHCTYVECGDFICDITNDATIVDWKPFLCCCPEQRKLNIDKE